MRLPLVAIAATAASLFQTSQAGTDDHRYKKGEHVELWVNKVWNKIVTKQASFSPAAAVIVPCVITVMFARRLVFVSRGEGMPTICLLDGRHLLR